MKFKVGDYVRFIGNDDCVNLDESCYAVNDDLFGVVVGICVDGDYIVYFPEVEERGLFNNHASFHSCKGELSSDRGLFIYAGYSNNQWFGENNWEVCDGPEFWRL